MRPIYIEPLELEAKYRELASLGRNLGIPIPECHLEIKVTLPGVRKPVHWHKQRSHSWTRNAYNSMATFMMGIQSTGGYDAGHTSSKTTTGAVGNKSYMFFPGRTSQYDSDYSNDVFSNNIGYMQAVGVITSGIVVGIGAGVESFNDYAMSSICAEGTGANQLHYVAEAVPVQAYDPGTKTYTTTWSRYMNNNSPGDVTITEVGLIASCLLGDTTSNCLFARDVLSPAVVVPASGQILASYAIALVFPA
jgi:hypothetical protein